jgi:hypothetical protein
VNVTGINSIQDDSCTADGGWMMDAIFYEKKMKGQSNSIIIRPKPNAIDSYLYFSQGNETI